MILFFNTVLQHPSGYLARVLMSCLGASRVTFDLARLQHTKALDL